MRLWGLTLGVGLAHLVVLWGANQWGGAPSALADWHKPEFTHQLDLDSTKQAPHPQHGATSGDGTAVPASTVGQALQVRTFTSASQMLAKTKIKIKTTTTAKTRQNPSHAQAKAQGQALATASKPHTNHPNAAALVEPTPDTSTHPATSDTPETPNPTATAATAPTLLVSEPSPLANPVPAALAENLNKKEALPLDNKAVDAIKKEVELPVDVAAAVAHWPAATRLNYKLHGNYRGDLHGKASVMWQRQSTRYQVQVDVGVALLFHLRMTSQGRITPQALWPEVYQEERRGKMRGAQMGDAVVQLDNGQTMPRPQLLQDTASQFVQLAQDFAHQRRPLQVGAVIRVPLARPGGIDEWVYDVVAMDTLSTPLGPVPAFHLQPRPLSKARSGVDVDMWFAPSLQHLPVRIRLNLGADTWLDLQLESIDQAQSPAAKT